MEKLYKMRGGMIGAILVCWVFNFYGQENLFVYKYEGEPFIEVNDSIKTVKNGTILDKNTSLIMKRDDIVFILNSKGKVFELVQTGRFEYKDLMKLIKQNSIRGKASFAENYFAYIWKEFTNNMTKRDDKTGVVLRGDEVILMRFPADSIRIFSNEISFKWDGIPNKEWEYYLFIKDLSSNKVYRKSSKDNFVTVVVAESELKYGNDYRWGISESKYEAFDKLKTFQFRLLSQEEFDKYKKDLKKLTKELKEMGMTDKEIKESLCQYSKFCY